MRRRSETHMSSLHHEDEVGNLDADVEDPVSPALQCTLLDLGGDLLVEIIRLLRMLGSGAGAALTSAVASCRPMLHAALGTGVIRLKLDAGAADLDW